MNKRRVMIAAIAVCLIAILACGSLAYFTFTGVKVTNQFYTYSTEDFPDGPPADVKELFSIEIYETDADGNKDYDGLTYEEVLPGSELAKDPTVKNTGKYDAWVRLTVTITNAANWTKACEEIGLTDLGQIFLNFNDEDDDEKVTGWHRADGPIVDAAANTITYVYYSNNPLKAGQESTLFDGMKIPEKLTVEHMLALSEFQIIIAGDAIQSDNNGTTAAAGFANWTN